MIKSGLLGAGVGFVYVMSLALLSPLCTLCVVPFLGLGVGYLASWFDQPGKLESNLGRGVIAGGMTGLGVMVGQILASLVTGILVTNLETLPTEFSDLGIFQSVLANPDQYWQTTLTMGAFCSIFNLGLIIVLGALGSLLWFQTYKKRLTTTV
ncbi:MAG: hypothetical protein KDI62_13825 [Anaerolineae bacterium]|nr:hypothetical protein [Anaerolineae bacterium]MCB0179307.1 hypothetical protein [Anaerolineae bacterium]